MFAASAAGQTSPLSVLVGAQPGLRAPTGLDLDQAGDLFVADSAANSVTEYPPSSSGPASPLATIAGAHGPRRSSLSLRVAAHARSTAASVHVQTPVAHAHPWQRHRPAGARFRFSRLSRPARTHSRGRPDPRREHRSREADADASRQVHVAACHQPPRRQRVAPTSQARHRGDDHHSRWRRYPKPSTEHHMHGLSQLLFERSPGPLRQNGA
jgi:hypothetical protein